MDLAFTPEEQKPARLATLVTRRSARADSAVQKSSRHNRCWPIWWGASGLLPARLLFLVGRKGFAVSERQSIKTILIISTSMVLVIAQIISGLVQYRDQASMARNQISAVAEQAVQPLISLASNAIDGGNAMILNNKEAQSLYGATRVLFLRMEGTSAGAPKTEWSEAIAPQKIAYEFVAKGQDGVKLAGVVQSGGLLEDERLYVVRIPLPSVKNGGELIAVFSAAELEGLKKQVVLRVGGVCLIITLLGILPIWWFGLCNSQLRADFDAHPGWSRPFWGQILSGAVRGGTG